MIFGSAKIVAVYHSKQDGMKRDFVVGDICAKISESTQSTMKLTNHGGDWSVRTNLHKPFFLSGRADGI
jgi:hypothetical protein